MTRAIGWVASQKKSLPVVMQRLAVIVEDAQSVEQV
jgi:hypothetical protein